jgi:hypothetical protein
MAGKARRGKVRLDWVWTGVARQAWLGMLRQRMARQGVAQHGRLGWAWFGMTWRGTDWQARRGTARLRVVWRGTAGTASSMARLGMAWQSNARQAFFNKEKL